MGGRATRRPRVLITGATGQVGAFVLRHLKNTDSVDIVAGMRSPERGEGLGVDSVFLDLDRPESLDPALRGTEVAFLATGYTVDMLRQSKAFVDAARRQGIRHIVHLGACGDDETLVPHWGWHQMVERYIEWSGVAFTHLRPEYFMQQLLGSRSRSVVSKGEITGYMGGARASWVDCDDIGLLAATCLASPAEHSGKTYRLGYDAKSFDEIAAILTETVGQPFRYNARPPEEYLARRLAEGGEPAYIRSVYDNHVAAAAGRIRDFDRVFDNFKSLTGREPATWRGFAERHRDEFRY